MTEVIDFPKIKSPFVRETINGRYIVTPKIEEGYEWVFEAPGVKAVDKLHGSNFCVIIQNGEVQSIDDRGTRIWHSPSLDLTVTGFANMILEGIIMNRKHLMNREGRIYGELIGPKINGNIHRLSHHRFVPFEYLKNTCHWKSWINGDYPKTFESISEWFKDLPSLYTQKATGEQRHAEGLIFYHPDGRMAKLRRSMFPWYRDLND